MFLGAIAMGLGAVFGITGKFEPYLWTLISILAAIVIVRTRPTKPVLYAFLVSFCAMISTFIAAANFDLYLRNNPHAAAQYAKLPPTISPQMFLVATAPFVALIYGIVTSGITWLVTKLWFGKPTRPSPPQTA